MKDKNNRSFWQRFAKLYGPFMKSNSALYKNVCDEIRPFLRQEMDVLELACGSGQFSFPLAGEVRVWEATDFSEAMIDEADKKPCPDNLRFSVQDATNLPYDPGTFDAVFISNALHIMPEPDKALAEIRKVLKPGGLLLAPTFLHGNSTGFRLRVKMMELFGFHTFHKWDESGFVEYLEQQGFKVVSHKIMGDSLASLCFVAAVCD